MELLTDRQLMDVRGGFFSLKFISAIGGGIVFIIGLIDGIVRPVKC